MKDKFQGIYEKMEGVDANAENSLAGEQESLRIVTSGEKKKKVDEDSGKDAAPVDTWKMTPAQYRAHLKKQDNKSGMVKHVKGGATVVGHFGEDAGMDDVAKGHQKKIAIQTLKMNDVMARVMGGMSKEEARSFLKGIGYSDAKIAALEA